MPNPFKRHQADPPQFLHHASEASLTTHIDTLHAHSKASPGRIRSDSPAGVRITSESPVVAGTDLKLGETPMTLSADFSAPVSAVSDAPADNAHLSRRTMLGLIAASLSGLAISGIPSVGAYATGVRKSTARDALEVGTYRPDATTTGVLPGSTLTIVNTHTPVSNTTYTNLDVRCAVVPGPSVGNVTYRNCIFRGPDAAPTSFSSLYTMFRPHQRGFVFLDCTFLPQHPDFRWVGLQGYGFTLRRCDLSKLVDCVEVFNCNNGPGGAGDNSLRNGPSDVVIEQCFFHDQAYWGPETDTGAARNGSHSDAIQWEGCTGLVVRGNYITGQLKPQYQPNFCGGTQTNSALMIKPDAGNIGGGLISQNCLGGGAVTINVADAPAKNRYIQDLGSITDNHFYRDQMYKPTAFIVGVNKVAGHADISVNTTGNIFADNSAPVPVIRKFY
jgi:hypothetical protein